MPPTRSQRRNRSATTASAALVPRRSRRNASSTFSPPHEEPTQSVTPAVSTSASAIQLPADLVQSLVFTVTEEVKKQLKSLLPPQPSAATDVLEMPIGITNSASQSAASPLLESASPAILVPGAIASAHASITGEPQLLPTICPSNPSQIFQSSSLPIDSRVSAKVKTKIWNEEFVDFGNLSSSPHEDKYRISFQNFDPLRPASVFLEPTSKPKVISSIEGWLQAFHIFVGVYTQKYSYEAPALMKYCHVVQDLAIRGQNWRYYDENFRFLRQNSVNRVPWGTVHWELWLRSQYPVARKPQSNPSYPRPKQQGLRVPKGYCFKFHKGEMCSGCEFKHSCFKCQGQHRFSQCNFRGAKFPRNDQSAKSNTTSPNTNKN